MKKTLLSSALFCLIALSIAAQNTASKLSPYTKKYLKEARNISGEQRQPDNYVYKTFNNKKYISGLIKVNAGIDESQLNTLGIKIGTKAGRIWTTQVPVENASAFTQLSGIDYIQFDEPAVADLDNARADTHADSVHAGINLPMPYNGEGVVVGVVDAGYDFGHPAYFDVNGTGYRVKKVWLQKNNTGPAPSGYAYGTEMTDSIALWTLGTDNGGTHATHVSGICGGSGFGSPNSNQQFKGFAYKSEMVLVAITPDKSQWISTGVSDMIDGINYIFNYAASVSKPAVVNLSWGSPLGPRDGTGLFSQALDNLTGSGKIFVCSGGNNGQDSIHIQKTFTPTDQYVNTYLDIANTPVGKKTWVDIWGDSAKTFCVQVSLHNGTFIDSTGWICLDDSTHDFFLIGSNNDTCWLSMITSASEFNNKPRVFLDFDSRLVSDSIMISVQAMDGTINFWNTFVYNTSGYYGAFLNYGKPNAVNGDHEITISDIAASRSAISVGAYASKINWTNISGNSYTYVNYVAKGNIVPFSSHGPTTDGRIKPDITGPGLTVGSAISSYDTSFASTGTSYLFVINNYHNPSNNRDYPYGMLSGTSMSSPAVSGITALLLQVKNDLTPQDVKDIYTLTAITDNFTGTIPPGGTNIWGNGKVNAYGAVQRVVQIVAGVNGISNPTLECNLYPNPNEGSFILDYTGKKSEQLEIDIADVLGKIIMHENWTTNPGYNFKTIDLKDISPGVYFTKISSKEGSSVIRMTVSK